MTRVRNNARQQIPNHWTQIKTLHKRKLYAKTEGKKQCQRYAAGSPRVGFWNLAFDVTNITVSKSRFFSQSSSGFSLSFQFDFNHPLPNSQQQENAPSPLNFGFLYADRKEIQVCSLSWHGILPIPRAKIMTCMEFSTENWLRLLRTNCLSKSTT